MREAGGLFLGKTNTIESGYHCGSTDNLDLSTQMALLEVQGRSVEPQTGHAHGSANPHYWLDPANGEIMSAEWWRGIGDTLEGKTSSVAMPAFDSATGLSEMRTAG